MTSREMVQGAAARNQRTLADAIVATNRFREQDARFKSHDGMDLDPSTPEIESGDMNSIGAPSRMTVLLMTEIPFRIKILIHGCNMNFQMYGLQIA